MATIIIGIICCAIAVLCAVYASFTARRKGPVLSNPYIWYSKEEREKEFAKEGVKDAAYRQLTVVFVCLAAMFVFLALLTFTSWGWVYIPMAVLTVFVLVYAIASSVKHMK